MSEKTRTVDVKFSLTVTVPLRDCTGAEVRRCRRCGNR